MYDYYRYKLKTKHCFSNHIYILEVESYGFKKEKKNNNLPEDSGLERIGAKI